MKTRWIALAAAAAVLSAATANAQTAATTAPKARPVVAAAPAAVAATVEQTTPVPPVPPAPQAPPAPPAPQAAAAPPSPQAPPAPRAPRAPVAARSTGEAPAPEPVRHPRGQLVNLRLEFTVTDQVGSAPPVKKTITMNVADGESGRIRTNAEVFRKGSAPTVVPLSIDANPQIEGSRIRLRASLEYQLLKDAPEPDVPAGKTSITQGVTAILSDGVSMVLSQSADPLTDRKVTLEVKATIIK
jgi:hypothetical protein